MFTLFSLCPFLSYLTVTLWHQTWFYLCSPWRCSSLHQLLHISPWGPTPRAPASPDALAVQRSQRRSHKTQNLNQDSREPVWSYGSGLEENQEPGRSLYLWNTKMIVFWVQGDKLKLHGLEIGLVTHRLQIYSPPSPTSVASLAQPSEITTCKNARWKRSINALPVPVQRRN